MDDVGPLVVDQKSFAMPEAKAAQSQVLADAHQNVRMMMQRMANKTGFVGNFLLRVVCLCTHRRF